ncbi:sulfur carrier protein ThiS [Nocardioides sp. Bht2]|uniref:sulfur carrier protein ThiS n=1 Tax=Nocardioides sp. Bht2 TaxID=3392297 RepID=UPI0039B51E34
MRITVNGVDESLPQGWTLGDLVARHRPEQAGSAVAHNGMVVPRIRYRSTVLAPGDVVEIVTAVQGG